MPERSARPARHVLDPFDRLSEVLFGLIMVLTFTGSLSVAEAGRDDIRKMLIGALGCNLAWGIIDAVLYLMGRLVENARDLNNLAAVRMSANPQDAHRLIAESLPSLIASILKSVDLEAMRQRLKELPDRRERAHLRKDDWLGALGVFLLVFLATFPVVIPFLLMRNAQPALRISNLIAIVLLFLTGYTFGRMTARHPLWLGISMVIIGSTLVGITMALGG